MKFIISRTILHQALSICGRAVDNKFIVATSCYRLQKDLISACNMEISISKKVSMEAMGDFDILMPAEQLKKLITSLPDQPLTFTFEPFKDKNEDFYNIEIKSSSGIYKLIGHNAENFPELTTETGNGISLLYEDLTEALYRTSYACLNDNTGNKLNGLSMIANSNKIYFAGFNGQSFALFNIPGKFEEFELLLGPSIISAICSIVLQGECVLIYSTKSITITVSDIEIKSVLMDEKFLDWRPLFQKPNDYISVSRMDFIGALKRILMFANQTSHHLEITISDNELKVFGEDIDYSHNANEQLKCSTYPDTITIGLNGNFTVEALNKMTSDEVYIFFTSPLRPVLFMETIDNENMALIAPVMPNSSN